MPKTKLLFFAIGMLTTVSTLPMTYDNRFIPLFQRPRFLLDGLQNTCAVDYSIMTGSSAFDSAEKDIGIPELHGTFDQGKLADAFVAAGMPNPLPSEWQGVEIPWKTSGKIQAQAVRFFVHKKIVDWLSVGFSWLFMHAHANQEFKLDSTRLILSASDKLELEERRREMFDLLCLNKNYANQSGFGDIDSYVRVGHTWDHTYKFRTIDIGARVGVMIPSGIKRDNNSPASIPFGGDGHWGMYGALDGLFELKEDFKFGMFFRFNKRFSRTSCQRMPVLGEPRIFGATVGQAHVDPGLTFIFSPFFVLENVRQGLGLGVQYHLTKHWEDTWTDARSDTSIPVDLKQVDTLSQWASDYFTLHAFYDFG
ncbi:MAG: hypothetical protein Q8Q25_02170, partial [bacterium]|nr:hypothetical protein [bacterium]